MPFLGYLGSKPTMGASNKAPFSFDGYLFKLSVFFAFKLIYRHDILLERNGTLLADQISLADRINDTLTPVSIAVEPQAQGKVLPLPWVGGIQRGCNYSLRIVNSIRRFCRRPASVLLSATGSLDPTPRETIRDAAMSWSSSH